MRRKTNSPRELKFELNDFFKQLAVFFFIIKIDFKLSTIVQNSTFPNYY